MDSDIDIIQNEIRALEVKKSQYENMREQITKTINRLNYSIIAGERAYSMFSKVYSESDNATTKIRELENETYKVIEIKSDFTNILERIEEEIKRITNNILNVEEQLQELLASQNSE